MINPKTLLKLPSNFKNICKIYPPSVNQIIEEDKFSIYQKMLTISQEEIEDEYVEEGRDLKELLNPFEYILNNAYNNKTFEALLREAFDFFIKEPVYFFYEQKIIVIGDIEKELKNIKSVEQLRILKEDDYFDFQNLVRLALGNEQVSRPDPTEDPRVKRIKAKARYRDKIKAKQGKGLQLSSTLISICCMNVGLNLLNIGEISYASLQPLIRYYQEKEKYEIDIDSLLAGADKKKIKPKYWVRNIDE